MLEAIFFATPFWFICLLVATVPLIRGPFRIRKRHIVARTCQAGIFGLWLAGMGGGILTGLNTGAAGFLGATFLPETFSRLCQAAPLMSLAGIGLVTITFYTYPYPPATQETMTREDKAA